MEILKQTRKIANITNFTPVLEVNLNDIKDIKYIDNGTEFKYDSNTLFFFNHNLVKYISSNNK